jgi:hypothetical protein
MEGRVLVQLSFVKGDILTVALKFIILLKASTILGDVLLQPENT